MDASTLRNEFQTVQRYFSRPVAILKSYDWKNLRPDLVAGLTVAVILLPQAMAFALIAELPPQMGLYTAILGSIIGALWGSSHQLQTGPTNTASLLVFSILLTITTPDAPDYLITVGMFTLLVGIFRLLMGLAHVGVLVNFVSDSVVVGFTAGAGMLIFFNQLRHLLRLEIPSTPGLLDTLGLLGAHVFETHVPSLLLGVVTIVIIWVARRINRHLPGPLFGMIFAAALAAGLGLGQSGVHLIGELPKGLPPFVRLPIFDLNMIGKLSTGALAVAAIGLVEPLSIARSIAVHTRQRVDSNQEFIGQGLANLACAFFSGYTCSGSFTRSAVNHQAGARSPIANIFCGLFVLVAMLALGSLAAYIPLPALAGVVVLVAFGLIDRREMLRIWRGARGDRVIMLVTLFATLLLPLQFAVLVGILMSLAYYLMKTSAPQVRAVVPDGNFEFLVPQRDRPACPQLAIVEVLGDLYFGAAHHVEERILAFRAYHPTQRYLLLRMFGVQQVDISGIHALESLARTYREAGGDVYISRYQPEALEVMQDTGFVYALGEDHFLGRDQNAVGHLYHKVLDPAICVYECPVRAFKECQSLPKRLDLIEAAPHTHAPNGHVHYVEAQELWRVLHSPNPPRLIDVREPREYRQGHIPQALSLPLPQLLKNPEGTIPITPLVLVCHGGRRSSRAAGLLAERGVNDVRVLRGGMQAWEAARLFEAHD